MIENAKVIPVFSNETLLEIQRSIGFESRFLDALKFLKAWYLIPESEKGMLGQKATVRECDHHLLYKDFVDGQIDTLDIEPLMANCVQAFMGLKSEVQVSELFGSILKSARTLVEEAVIVVKNSDA